MSGLTYKETRSLGYKVGKELWNTCLDDSERNLGIHQIKNCSKSN